MENKEIPQEFLDNVDEIRAKAYLISKDIIRTVVKYESAPAGVLALMTVLITTTLKSNIPKDDFLNQIEHVWEQILKMKDEE